MASIRPTKKSSIPPKKTGRPSAITTTRPATPRSKHAGDGRPPFVRIALTVLSLGLFLATLSAVCLGGVFWYYSRGLPSADSLRKYAPPQTTRVVDRSGHVLAEVFSERRTVVPMERIPRVLVLSVLAAEDADFYHHSGMDLPGMVRVFWKALVRGKPTQGGSTITQQVVKNLLLTPERTLERKIKELILARRLEQELTKDEILFLYLNHINFGHGRYGVQEASQFYFGKDVDKLSLAEASLIAGIPQSPTYLSPRTHPDAAKRRQLFVLEQLEKKHDLYWDDLPLEEIAKAKLGLPALAPMPNVGEQAPEMAQLAKQALIDAIGEQKAMQGGYTVETTLDLQLEQAARAALRKGLAQLDARQGHLAPFEGPRVSDKALAKLERETRVDHERRKELRPGGTYDAVVLGTPDSAHIDLSLNGVAARASMATLARFNPKHLDAPHFIKKGVKVRAAVLAMYDGKPVDVKLAFGPEAALVIVDPRTREVLAMVGGYEATAGFNRATQALRQPGSTFKPIVYALGLKSRKFTPATLVIDAPGVYDKYKPSNYETWTYEGPVRLRHGLAQSINAVAVRVIDDLSPASVVDFAHKLGITSPLDPSLALSLGASEVRLTELTNVYATFAAGGRFAPINLVKRIVDAGGRAVRPQSPEPTRDVLSAAEAYLITSLLTSVVESGTGARAKALGRPAAGKTGTSNQARDAWFVGYTSDLVCGVWVGYDDHRPIGAKESGGKSALPIWLDAMKAAHAGKPVRGFEMPSGVVTARIDPATGLLAYEGEEGALDEVFLEGTVPTQTALPPDVADPTTFMMEQIAP